jgi:SAM-dependent methyltransferase
MSLKTLVKGAMPQAIRHQWRAVRVQHQSAAFRGKSNAEVFSHIYSRNMWGGNQGEFNSGNGSSDALSADYVKAIARLVKKEGVRSILDIGCGDFRVGRLVESFVDRYIGVDVVPSLITHLREKWENEKISFLAADARTNTLPEADLVLVRQVLQHLSNADICMVLENLSRYPLIVITETHPVCLDGFRPNLDKPTGPDIRNYKHSAVVIDAPPFNLSNVSLLLEVNLQADETGDRDAEKLMTYLVRSPGNEAV